MRASIRRLADGALMLVAASHVWHWQQWRATNDVRMATDVVMGATAAHLEPIT